MAADLTYPLRGWSDVYTLLGTGSATLFGLLFVAVSFHLKQVVGDESRLGTRLVAGYTFSVFIYLVVLCVALLIPRLSAAGLGWMLVAFSAIGLALGWVTWRLGKRDDSLRPKQYLLLPLVAQLLLLATAVSLLMDPQAATFDLLAIAVIVLLVGVVHNTWELLVSLSE